MNRTVLAIGLGTFMVSGAFAQPAVDALSFEVASVKPAPPPAGDRIRVGISGGPGTPDPGRITYSNVPLKAIVAAAYNVKPNQVSGPGGPRATGLTSWRSCRLGPLRSRSLSCCKRY